MVELEETGGDRALPAVQKGIHLVNDLVQLLGSLVDEDGEDHHLAHLLFEHVMSVREILCCWHQPQLSETPMFTLTHRAFVIKNTMNSFLKRSKIMHHGHLSCKSKGVNVNKTCTFTLWASGMWRSDTVDVRKEDLIFCFNIKDILGIEVVSTGREPEFYVRTKTEEWYFRADSALHRDEWIDMLKFASARFNTLRDMRNYPVGARLEVLKRVQNYTTEPVAPVEREKEFLFAMVSTKTETQDVSGMGLVGVFPCKVKKRLRTNASRVIEIDLSHPPRLRVKKTNQEKMVTDQVFEVSDLLDYKIDTKTKTATVSCRQLKRLYSRDLRFDDSTLLHQFAAYLKMFSRGGENKTLEFLHRKTMLELKDKNTQYKTEIFNQSYGSTTTLRRGTGHRASMDGITFDVHARFGRLFSLLDDANGDNNAYSVWLAELNDELTEKMRLATLCSVLSGGLVPPDNPAKPKAYSCIDYTEQTGEVKCTCPQSFMDGRVLNSTASNPCLLDFVRLLLNCEGLADLQQCLQDEDSEIQALALKSVWQLHKLVPLLKNCKHYDSSMEIAILPFEWYVSYIKRMSLSLSCVETLFEALIGMIRYPSLSNMINTKPDNTADLIKYDSSPLVLLGQSIKNISLLPVILNALVSATGNVRVKGIKLVMEMVLSKKSKDNAKAILAEIGWQNWLLPFFSVGDDHAEGFADPLSGRTASLANHSPSSSSHQIEMFNFAIGLFSTLHFEALRIEKCKTAKESTTIMWKTLQHLKHFAKWGDDTIELYRAMCVSLMIKIETQARVFSQNWTFDEEDMDVWYSFFACISVLENFMFNQPSVADQLGVLHYRQDKCLDAPLISAIMVTLKKLKISEYNDQQMYAPGEKKIIRRGDQCMQFFTALEKLLRNHTEAEVLAQLVPLLTKFKKNNYAKNVRACLRQREKYPDNFLKMGNKSRQMNLAKMNLASRRALYKNNMDVQAELHRAKRTFHNVDQARLFVARAASRSTNRVKTGRQQSVYAKARRCESNHSGFSSARASNRMISIKTRQSNTESDGHAPLIARSSMLKSKSRIVTHIEPDTGRQVESELVTEELEGPEETFDQATTFVCFACGGELDPSDFYEFEGQAYCQVDFLALFASCNFCRKIIDGNFLELAGMRYHQDCLSCCECKSPFEEDMELYQEDGKIYCAVCYYRVYGSTCVVCNELIESDNNLQVNGKCYHVEHFQCCECGQKLQAEQDDDEEGEGDERKEAQFYCAGTDVYCVECYGKSFGVICFICEEMAYEDVVEMGEGISAHMTCVKCVTCSKQFSGDEDTAFFIESGQIFCAEHSEKSLDSAEICGICKKPLCEGVIEVDGQMVHTACITCAACGGTEDENGDQEYTEFQGFLYHASCLKCSVCGCHLEEGMNIYTVEGVLYCEQDYSAHVAPRCGTCSLSIVTGSLMRVGDMSFHADCFQCFICKQVFDEDAEFIIQSDRLYHRECYNHA